MNGLIAGFPYNGVVTVNRVIPKPEYTVDDLQERVAALRERQDLPFRQRFRRWFRDP